MTVFIEDICLWWGYSGFSPSNKETHIKCLMEKSLKCLLSSPAFFSLFHVNNVLCYSISFEHLGAVEVKNLTENSLAFYLLPSALCNIVFDLSQLALSSYLGPDSVEYCTQTVQLHKKNKQHFAEM